MPTDKLSALCLSVCGLTPFREFLSQLVEWLYLPAPDLTHVRYEYAFARGAQGSQYVALAEMHRDTA